MKNKVINGLMWNLMERFGVSGIQFILQIILARLLSPEDYGTLSIMIVFTSLATVFVQSGFNTALIQKKEVEEDDYSSVYWVSFFVATLLYVIIYFVAPFIASYYKMPNIKNTLRVLSLMLFPGALNSIQLAKARREMDFRKIFTSNMVGIIISGIVGIIIAYLGGGLWALVIQNILNVTIVCFVMIFTVNLKIKIFCDFKRVKLFFAFGWKLLISSLLDTLYQDIRSLVIGKKYDGGTLGYYNRGKQFPQFIISAINGAVQGVLLPAMSAEQSNDTRLNVMMRTSITMTSYIIFPMMAGLAAVAPALVSILLTDKWLPCVPFMQIYCFTFAFYPVHTCNLQAINAIGRSDIFLKLEIIKKGYGLIALLIAVFCFESPIAIAMTGAFTTVISCFVNAYPNKKLTGYSYIEQMRDILPSFFAAIIMFILVMYIGKLKINIVLLLGLQIVVGIVIYVFISIIMKLKPFYMIFELTKSLFKSK